jgi:hypothetical protein
LDLVHSGYKIDCAIQSIFALGVRDVEISKQSSFDSNTYGKSGVTDFEVIKYIINAFNLKVPIIIKRIDILDDDDIGEHEYYNYADSADGEVADPREDQYNFYLDDKLSYEEKNDKTVTFFDRRLKNGYATTIGMILSRRGGDRTSFGGHRIVAYKHDDQIYFFDPQQKYKGLPVHRDGDDLFVDRLTSEGVVERRVFNSPDIYKLISNRVDINSVTCMCIRNLPNPLPLVNTSCNLPYISKK